MFASMLLLNIYTHLGSNVTNAAAFTPLHLRSFAHRGCTASSPTTLGNQWRRPRRLSPLGFPARHFPVKRGRLAARSGIEASVARAVKLSALHCPRERTSGALNQPVQLIGLNDSAGWPLSALSSSRVVIGTAGLRTAKETPVQATRAKHVVLGRFRQSPAEVQARFPRRAER